MEEDIKKDLKEIKEDIERSEEQTEESKNQEEYDISPEKAEILVENLKEEIQKEEKVPETQVESEEEPSKFNLKKILLLIGIFVIIVFCILGILTGFILIKNKKSKKKKELSYKIKKQVYLNETKKSSITTPLSKKKLSTELIISKNSKKKPMSLFEYKFKDFLIPLTSNIFLDTDVILYFDTNVSMRDILANEIIYRRIIYNYLKNTSPVSWLSLKQRKEIEKKLQKLFEIKNIRPMPKKVEVNGIILKG